MFKANAVPITAQLKEHYNKMKCTRCPLQELKLKFKQQRGWMMDLMSENIMKAKMLTKILLQFRWITQIGARKNLYVYFMTYN